MTKEVHVVVDLHALLLATLPTAAAAVFTKNKFQAAPVVFSRDLLRRRKNAGVQSVVINSGCANAVTGKGGLEDAARMAAAAMAWEFPAVSIVSSCGRVYRVRYSEKKKRPPCQCPPVCMRAGHRSGLDNFLVPTFIGCTGSGMPKTTPVTML